MLLYHFVLGTFGFQFCDFKEGFKVLNDSKVVNVALC